jgi:hypothetical protein|tara:strand:+ start:952 stop:1110 length:159 start_codon:yes stop_codon:yes gene_type:complete
MYSKEQIENILKEIMGEEQLRSLRQVFEKYPELGREYIKANLDPDKDNEEEA